MKEPWAVLNKACLRSFHGTIAEKYCTWCEGYGKWLEKNRDGYKEPDDGSIEDARRRKELLDRWYVLKRMQGGTY